MLHPSFRLDALVIAALFAPLLAGCGAGEEGPLGTAQEASVCAAGATVKGVDVSVFQDTVDWSTVKAAGIDFGIARISDGSFLDTQFDANWSGMKAQGLVRGAYQFFEPGEDPTTQANIVISAVGVLGDGDLPVTADMEVTGGQSPGTIAANLQTWVTKVQAGTGKAPMIYTAEGYWDSDVASSAFGNLPLWAANWDVTCPTLATGWSNWKIWQYADNGTVNGIPDTVDLDEYNGDLTALQGFAGGSGAAEYGAAYVSQSWPLATTTMQMTVNQTLPANIVLKNIGTKSWDGATHLGTTEPRDRTSPFAAPDWISPNRLAGLPAGMTVPPGGTFEFKFDFHAPSTPGMYDEHYGVVEDGVAWFSDPGQGGPPDSDIEAKIQVVATGASSSTSSSSSSSGIGTGGAGGATGAGGAGGGATGASGPGGSSTSSGATASSGETSSSGGIHGEVSGSCSCEVAGDGERGASAAWLAAAGALVLAGRRRRR
jgi:lysozyme